VSGSCEHSNETWGYVLTSQAIIRISRGILLHLADMMSQLVTQLFYDTHSAAEVT
jgi:hypothetical protein